MKKWFSIVKQFIQENFRFLCFLVILYIFLTFPLPYYIYTGGGIIPVANRIDVDNEEKEKGSFNLAYVSEWRGTIATIFLSKFRSDWEVTPKEAYTLNEDDKEKDILFRNQIALEEANQNATIMAYKEANKEYKIKKTHFYVLYVEDKEKAPLEVGDSLLRVNDKEISSLDMYRKVVSETSVKDKIKVDILRNGKEKEVYLEVYLKDNKKMTGIAVKEIYDLETTPKLRIHFRSIESGPSGGLTTALAIYNRLTKSDLTNGKKIVGTGTLESDGSVGEIGGVVYKLRGAVKNKADIFLVPSGDNYDECQKEVKKRGYSIQLIAVKSFKDAVNKLKNIQEK